MGRRGREDSVFREVVRKSLFVQIIKKKAVTLSTAFFYGFFTTKLVLIEMITRGEHSLKTYSIVSITL